VSFRRITVLDCGASRVAAGVFAEENGSPPLESVTAESLAPATGTNWSAAVAEWVGKLAAACRGSQVVLVLPPHAVLLKQMRTPRLSPAKSRQVLTFAVGQAWPHAPGELVWDAVGSSMQGEETDHLVVAARLPMLAPIYRAIQDAGLELTAVLPSLLALRAAEATAATSSCRLVIEMGERACTFLQIDGERFAVRSLAPNLAEPGDAVTRLAQEATRTLLHFGRQNQFANPEQVVLAAEETWAPDRVSRLSELVKLPVVCLDPAPGPGSRGGEAEAGMALARMRGGAAIGFGRAGPVVNLIPEAMRERRRMRRRRSWLIAAGLLLVATPLWPIFVLRAESAAKRRDMVEREKALAPFLARSRRLQAHQSEIDRLRRELEWLQELSGRRTAWLGFMADLQARTQAVEDVWLERLHPVDPGGDDPMKLALSGYVLDRGTRPVAEKIKTLVRELRTIPAVATVEGERFDASRPHLLRFELVLVISAEHPL